MVSVVFWWPAPSWTGPDSLLSTSTTFVATTLLNNQFCGPHRLSVIMANSLRSKASGPVPDGLCLQKTTETIHYYTSLQLLFQQLCWKINPWCRPCSRPTPGSLWSLDLTQMVLAIRKKLKTTHLNIPNNFCFNNFAQKSIPGVVLAHGLLLAVFGAWTSPRWSWLSGKSWNQPT